MVSLTSTLDNGYLIFESNIYFIISKYQFIMIFNQKISYKTIFFLIILILYKFFYIRNEHFPDIKRKKFVSNEIESFSGLMHTKCDRSINHLACARIHTETKLFSPKTDWPSSEERALFPSVILHRPSRPECVWQHCIRVQREERAQNRLVSKVIRPPSPVSRVLR